MKVMKKLRLRDLVLPPAVERTVQRLQGALEAAETIQELRLIEQRAEGFVLGLETSLGVRQDTIEELYIGFEQAVIDRLSNLETVRIQRH